MKSATEVQRECNDLDPDLAFIVEHWHDLKPDVRRSIAHTVRASVQPPDPAQRRQAVQEALRRAHQEQA